MHGILN